jgi:hypothetical protein
MAMGGEVGGCYHLFFLSSLSKDLHAYCWWYNLWNWTASSWWHPFGRNDASRRTLVRQSRRWCVLPLFPEACSWALVAARVLLLRIRLVAHMYRCTTWFGPTIFFVPRFVVVVLMTYSGRRWSRLCTVKPLYAMILAGIMLLHAGLTHSQTNHFTNELRYLVELWINRNEQPSTQD